MTENGPSWRIRVTHKQTAKGWRIDETTAELIVTPESLHLDANEELRALMRSAYEEATSEVVFRNMRDGYTTAIVGSPIGEGA